MGLTDRDYMRNPNTQWGRATRLNAAPTDGIILEANMGRPRASNPRPRRRRITMLVLWLTGGTAAFTVLWAIACAMVGAQWQGQGTTFTPIDVQDKPTIVGNNHGAR